MKFSKYIIHLLHTKIIIHLLHTRIYLLLKYIINCMDISIINILLYCITQLIVHITSKRQ